MRAAQYVRMSTERQQYSIENQMAAIAEYGASHDFKTVCTYSDHARSGIDLAPASWLAIDVGRHHRV
jgi:DNA invertase Pin-like site-specific DNA recombinase